jgi:hypothetical protein
MTVIPNNSELALCRQLGYVGDTYYYSDNLELD